MLQPFFISRQIIIRSGSDSKYWQMPFNKAA